MKRPNVFVIAIGVLMAVSMPAAAQQSQQEPSFKEKLEAWLPGMGAENILDRQKPQQSLQEALYGLGVPGREAELAEACKAIAEKLGPEVAKPARIWMLRQLEFSGGAECVDAVAALLKDNDSQIRDCARRTLQNNPAPEANAKLLAGLASAVDDTQRVAIINALGYRSDASSVRALSELLSYRNSDAAAAAADALGKIGGTEAARALAEARPKCREAIKRRVADAYLRCADKLLREGKRAEAEAIYEELSDLDAPRPIRLAAVQGRLNAAGDEAAEVVVRMLAGDDADAQAIAAGHVGSLDGPAVRQLAEKFPKLSASAQMLLSAALAAKGDKTAMPVATAAANSDADEVRIAGLRALGRLGDASSVPMLTDALAAGGQPGEAARESLREVHGEGVDEAIVTAMRRAETGLRKTLIDLLRERSAVNAAGALLQQAEHDDAGVRDLAIQGLGDLAEPNHVAPMIAILLKMKKGRQRDAMEKAIMMTCNRTADAGRQADPVLAVVSRSGKEDRCTLLPLLGRIGGHSALEEVNKAIQSDEAEVREAGVRAICNWPDSTVADELLELAQRAASDSHRTWALRAYIRVITLPTDRPHEQTLAMLKKAMEMADRDDERRLVVSRASSARHVQTLRWLVPYLDDAAVSAQACRAIVELAHHRDLMGPNQDEFRKALDKVISISEDPSLIDRAKRYMSGL